MAGKHMKMPSNATVVRKMQIKGAMRCQFTSIGLTQTKMSNNIKCWQGYGGKGALIHVKVCGHLEKQSGNIC